MTDSLSEKNLPLALDRETGPGGEGRPTRKRVWLVFARRRYEESLYQVGTVTAEDAEMARLFAQSIYDEHPWIEMLVTPRDEAHVVIAA